MNNLKNDEYFVRKMLTDLYFITEQMQGVSMRTLGENQVLMDSMCFRLIQIQENAKKLSEVYKLAHSKIQWRDIAGLRNYIVHDYGNVDLSILFSTLTSDIPNLIKELEQD
jgi:uncharacterized protein with HEPN domain